MSIKQGQDAVFFNEEGNEWFKRNKEGLARRLENDCVLKALAGKLEPVPKSILEVGAANGFRLAHLHEVTGARCVAVEPSTNAIADGEASFPTVEFRRGLISDIPMEDGEQFDLVIVSGVMLLVDRLSIAHAIASLDSSIRDGGLLVMRDFLPDHPTCNPWHHRSDGTKVYKQDYAACFTALGTYAVEKTAITEHGSAYDSDDASDRRIATSVLRKNLYGLYKPGQRNLADAESRK